MLVVSAAPQLKVSDDRLSVTGEKGYSMVRATHGMWTCSRVAALWSNGVFSDRHDFFYNEFNCIMDDNPLYIKLAVFQGKQHYMCRKIHYSEFSVSGAI